ncbi:MAG: hypothetical protein FWE44_03320, partial [Defluviitaleaceae bacterium]|nr:hypothetical protein [Defluviitaleaceae bacterium]
VCDMDSFKAMQVAAQNVYIHPDVNRYIVDMVEKTRRHEGIALGISTRGMLALARIAQAYCILNGQDFVTPKEIVHLLPYVFAHRLVLKGGLRNRPAAAKSILDNIIEEVVTPVEEWKRR